MFSSVRAARYKTSVGKSDKDGFSLCLVEGIGAYSLTSVARLQVVAKKANEIRAVDEPP
jgi:hypothetical protein